jgi:RimJ/RimL family protein N-acetyltransferase
VAFLIAVSEVALLVHNGWRSERNKEKDMDLENSLFEGKLICLSPMDPEKDADIESRWTHDAEYLRLIKAEIARPLSPEEVKKEYEKIQKSMDEDKNEFYFTIRSRSEERLLGFARIYGILWTTGYAMVQLGIGDPRDRRQGFGAEALRLLLRYAFGELNLFRLTAWVPEYNTTAQRFFEKSGFTLEVRRRQALHRDNRRWDMLHLGLLREEWQLSQQ